MTIIRSAYRVNGGPEVLLHTGPQSLDEALVSMLKYEYGYGGRPTVLEPGRVVTMTYVLNCKDRTVWEGEVEEMRPLVEISAAFAHTFNADVHAALTETLTSKVLDMSGGNAFLIVNLAPMLIGHARLKVLCLLLCGEVDEEAVVLSQKLDIEDLVPAVTLAHEGGKSFKAVCRELGLDAAP